MMEINAGGKKIMTIGDNEQTFIHDKHIAEEIEKLSDKDKKPSYTLVEDSDK